MIVSDVLASKGAAVATISPTATIGEVVGVLVGRRIGALVVSADGRHVQGIISERDVAIGLHAHGAAVLDLPVTALMTVDVATCGLQDRIQDVARVMTDGRFRHLPVLRDGELAGIVSIGDIVKKRIDELETEQDQLVGYLHG